jgi:hypothetical protein
VKVCQPANGCHIDGDLCRQSSDCCGGAGSGVPGDGNVVCDIAAGQTVGICRNPTGCNPEGDVCHYQNYACSISSARNDCCGAVGNSGECQLDPLGVPRCHGIGTCKNPGETCAYTGDCCNGVPCVPGGDGGLVCGAAPPDGGVACVPNTGACTVNADCCSGNQCNVPAGSTHGTCGPTTPPPGSDAGSCSLYGQACTADSQCCNGVPCGTGTGPCNGASNCTCVYPVR